LFCDWGRQITAEDRFPMIHFPLYGPMKFRKEHKCGIIYRDPLKALNDIVLESMYAMNKYHLFIGSPE
jgi:hypothetical protein